MRVTPLEGRLIQDAGVLARLEAAGAQQRVGVLVPRLSGEVVPEHGGGGLRLVDDAERHVGLGQAHQRLLDVARGLVLADDVAEAVDRAGVVARWR